MKPTSLKIDFKNADGFFSSLNFQICRSTRTKAFFGGLQDTVKGLTFHHGYSQTDQMMRPQKQMFERDTQVLDLITKSVNPVSEFGSQTTAFTCLSHDSRNDKVLIPLKYFDSELWIKRRIESTIFIQKMIRGFLARKRMENIKAISKQIDLEKTSLIHSESLRQENLKSMEIVRRTKPRVSSKDQRRLREFVSRIGQLEEHANDESQI